MMLAHLEQRAQHRVRRRADALVAIRLVRAAVAVAIAVAARRVVRGVVRRRRRRQVGAGVALAKANGGARGAIGDVCRRRDL